MSNVGVCVFYLAWNMMEKTSHSALNNSTTPG